MAGTGERMSLAVVADGWFLHGRHAAPTHQQSQLEGVPGGSSEPHRYGLLWKWGGALTDSGHGVECVNGACLVLTTEVHSLAPDGGRLAAADTVR